eukprot:PITA_17713
MNNHLAEAYLNENNKLDGSNYFGWQFKFQSLLEGHNAWAIVNNDEVKLNVIAGGTSTTIQHWDKWDTKVRMLLKLLVKYCIIPHIHDCKTAPKIWKTLKDLYEVKNTNQLLFLKKNILSIKMEEKDTIVAFISRIKELKNKPSDISEVVSDTDLVTITRNGMTDEYQMFINGLNAREKASVFEESTGILMQEEERRLTHKPQSSDLALMAKKKPFKGKPNASQKSSETPQRKMPHLKVNDGSHESPNEEWCVPLLVEEGSDESSDNNEPRQQQQQQEGEEDDVAVKPSPQKDDHTRFEATSPLRKSGRKVQLPTRYRENSFITSMMNVFEPSSYKETSQYSEWRAAMEEEYESILKNITWDLVKLPEGKQPIGCKWLYKPKFKLDKSIDKYEAWLVAKGYSHQ